MLLPSNKGELELELHAKGELCGGVDEVGRGCLAGPVYAAAAVLDMDRVNHLNSASKLLIRDSKTLSSTQRLKATALIRQVAIETAVAHATVTEIEELGILQATFLAMRRCIEALESPISQVLIDGNQRIPNLTINQMSLVRGDALCYSIAAASILAKVARDHEMNLAAKVYPEYGFDKHVGYGTAFHMQALRSYGICPLHRKNFAPVQKLVSSPENGRSQLFASS